MCVCLVATVVLRDDEGQYSEAVKGVKKVKGGPFDTARESRAKRAALLSDRIINSLFCCCGTMQTDSGRYGSQQSVNPVHQALSIHLYSQAISGEGRGSGVSYSYGSGIHDQRYRGGVSRHCGYVI